MSDAVETLIDISMTVVLHNNRVSKAPPVLHFMATNRWTQAQVETYCRERGWSYRIAHSAKAATP